MMRWLQWLRWVALTTLLLATAAQVATPAATACGAIQGTESILKAGTIVMLGEVHGTNEIPAFVSDLVCNALKQGLSVTIALEIPYEETNAVAAFLASDGSPKARAALVATRFWASKIQYGPSSDAELGLIDSLRRSRKAGLPVKVVLLDHFARSGGLNARDAFMASRLAAAAKASPRDLIVSLTGNYHNRTRKGAPWSADFRPMGLDLKERLPHRRIVALDAAYTGGTAWICTSDAPGAAVSCHSYKLHGSAADGSGPRRIVLDKSLEKQGYDGYFTVGKITASPPAAESSAQRSAPLNASH